jgi:hypothetical protein
MQDYWVKQDVNKPLYPDLIWSRPENRNQAGKLLIVGGNSQSFAAAAASYNESVTAGIGTAKVLLPDSLQKTVGRIIENGEYAPSTPSGSFSRQALAEILSYSHWADMVIMAGDLARNSETAIMLEQYVSKYQGLLCLTKDALDYFVFNPLIVTDRPNTLIVASFSQLQKIFVNAKSTTAVTFDMDIIRFVDTLHDFSIKHPAALIVKHLDNIFVAYNGQVSSTKIDSTDIWRIKYASRSCVWWIQNQDKAFEALTTSIIKT